MKSVEFRKDNSSKRATCCLLSIRRPFEAALETAKADLEEAREKRGEQAEAQLATAAANG
ncbi:MAG: hypothetical protein R3C56_34070 [Pirellulaceae bacterium]